MTDILAPFNFDVFSIKCPLNLPVFYIFIGATLKGKNICSKDVFDDTDTNIIWVWVHILLIGF